MDELLSANRLQRNSVLQLALWESWKSFLLACKNFFASRKKRAALLLVLPHYRIFARSTATHEWLTCILDILEVRNTFFKKKKTELKWWNQSSWWTHLKTTSKSTSPGLSDMTFFAHWLICSMWFHRKNIADQTKPQTKITSSMVMYMHALPSEWMMTLH